MWQCSYSVAVVYLSLSLWAFTHTSAAVESDCELLDFLQYTVSLPGTYQGTPTTDGDCLAGATDSNGGPAISCGNNLRLDNGVLDPDNFETGVYAWNENADVILIFTNSVIVKYVNLSFYNAPQATGGPVGLPSVDLAYSDNDQSFGVQNTISLPHTVLGNQDLSQSNSSMGYQNVSVVVPISLEGGQLYNFFRIRLLFPETTVVDWTLLSEVQAFGNTDATRCSVVNLPDGSETITLQEGDSAMQFGPDNVVSTLTLSCTVTNEGLFQIQWVLPDMTTIDSTSVADGSRTGILQVSRLSGAGEMDYQCQARYAPEGLPSQTDSPSNSMDSATFTLDFQADLKVQETPVTTVAGESVTLGCELYGYAGGAQEIEWMTNNERIANDSEFTITVVEGSLTLQNGGDTPGPSMVSLLTISNPTTSHAGSFICTVNLGGDSEIKTLTLNVMDSPSPPTETPTPPGPGGDSNIAPIIGGVVGGLAFLIVVVVVLIVIVCIKRSKQRKKGHVNLNRYSENMDGKFGHSDPVYSEVNKPPPPPLPPRFYQTGAYATIDAPREGNGHIELLKIGDPRDSIISAPAIPDGNPLPTKLKHQPDFLQVNPTYWSADNLDRHNSPASGTRRRVASVPSLDAADSPNHSTSLLNIYAQPSRIGPALPERQSSPSPAPLTANPLYSESLTPTLFHQNRPSESASPPADELHPYASIYDDPKPLKQSEGPLEITHENIHEVRNLGVGQFGQVILAMTVGVSLKDLKLSNTETDRSVSVLVAMKQLKPNAERMVKEAFEKEIKFMSRLNDDNVVRLLAICSMGSPFILMEYMENGDLNQYLRKHDIAPADDPPGDNQLPASILLYMAMQIAGGMRYLASLRFIHRDLATRNCLVGRKYTVKIADFGMSRSLYSSYYYRIRGRAMLPIRWMANECFYGKFSEKTDTWAFGVTMWEIFTFAKKQPFEDLSDQELIDDAVKGEERRLLEIPEYCPPEVYEVMLQCWIHEPTERASFEDVHSSLSALHAYSDIP